MKVVLARSTVIRDRETAKASTSRNKQVISNQAGLTVKPDPSYEKPIITLSDMSWKYKMDTHQQIYPGPTLTTSTPPPHYRTAAPP